MKKNNWLDIVNKSRGKGRRTDLSFMNQLLEALGHPEKELKYIHVAGTNGKGSTSTYISSILREAGYNVGLFTSPHLETICERIRINDELIELDDFERLMEVVAKAAFAIEETVEARYSAFELITAVAFLYFAEKAAEVDVVVLEAGVGGKVDSTNAIPAENVYATLVTSIGLDHMGVLGNTEEEIAAQKAGIFKTGVPAFIGDFKPEIAEVFRKHAKELGVTLYEVNRQDEQMQDVSLKEATQTFTYEGKSYETKMLGVHQIENASLAILVAQHLNERGLTIEETEISAGIAKAFWPGRLEKLSDQPLFFIDGAHNQIAVERLLETLKDQFGRDHYSFVIGMMKDKEYQAMIDQVWDLADRFVVVSPDPYRGFNAAEVAEMIQKQGKPAVAMENAGDVLELIEKDSKADDLWIQFGSLYLVGALKKAAKNQ